MLLAIELGFVALINAERLARKKESEFRLSVGGAPQVAMARVLWHGFINLEIWNFRRSY